MLIKQPQNDGYKSGKVFKKNSGSKRQERLQYCKDQLKATIRTLFFLSGGFLCFKFPFMIFFCLLFLADIILTD